MYVGRVANKKCIGYLDRTVQAVQTAAIRGGLVSRKNAGLQVDLRGVLRRQPRPVWGCVLRKSAAHQLARRSAFAVKAAAAVRRVVPGKSHVGQCGSSRRAAVQIGPCPLAAAEVGMELAIGHFCQSPRIVQAAALRSLVVEKNAARRFRKTVSAATAVLKHKVAADGQRPQTDGIAASKSNPVCAGVGSRAEQHMVGIFAVARQRKRGAAAAGSVVSIEIAAQDGGVGGRIGHLSATVGEAAVEAQVVPPDVKSPVSTVGRTDFGSSVEGFLGGLVGACRYKDGHGSSAATVCNRQRLI